MKRIKTNSRSLFSSLLIGSIRVYRVVKQGILDPLLISFFGAVSQCKYSESCSEYGLRMAKTHATIPAVRRIIRRILSCHG